ncbi:MAG: GIY-YIG nuclease family protein [Nitrospinae bacterium]|nr:GIY-YIG nuclease family protein [Nitrospinota bacterium]MZH04592.1 GIY-YIG nuclease family protein [Nitrospinota bacterium]MZH15184.1 GIY-YIG nuclease family protein [Nitrospinota bacterium]
MGYRANMWHVYLIRTRMGHLYTGVTQDVQRRFKEHQEGGVKGAKYLKGKKPLKLVFHKKIGSRSQALKTEAEIKKWPKKKKEALVNQDIPLTTF